MHQNVFDGPGSAQTRWGNLQHSPDPLAELKGREEREEGVANGREKEGNGRRKGEDPQAQCLKCVDANADLPIIKQLLIF